jgi:hypothetical protein
VGYESSANFDGPGLYFALDKKAEKKGARDRTRDRFYDIRKVHLRDEDIREEDAEHRLESVETRMKSKNEMLQTVKLQFKLIIVMTLFLEVSTTKDRDWTNEVIIT